VSTCNLLQGKSFADGWGDMYASAAEVDTGIAPSVWVAIVVAVIALVGVLVGQAITLYNARAQRRNEQTKTVRDEVQKLMRVFFDFAEFAQSTYPGKKMAQQADLYDEEWGRVAGPLAAMAANMAGRGRHRDAALTLMDGLGRQATAYREGESIGDWPRVGYVQMAWAGFETVAAWLRGERIPLDSRRVVRAARRMRSTLDAEYRWRDLQQKKSHKTGVVRSAWRVSRFWVRGKWKAWFATPARSCWDFLLAP
jgi:hypothetical protein